MSNRNDFCTTAHQVRMSMLLVLSLMSAVCFLTSIQVPYKEGRATGTWCAGIIPHPSEKFMRVPHLTLSLSQPAPQLGRKYFSRVPVGLTARFVEYFNGKCCCGNICLLPSNMMKYALKVPLCLVACVRSKLNILNHMTLVQISS